MRPTVKMFKNYIRMKTATVSCGKLYYYAATDVVKLKRNLYISSAHPLDVRSVPRREFSELTYLAYKLFGEV